jgi:PST family polysaccharide transporter
LVKSLTDKTISGLNWNFIRNYSTAISSIVIGVILGRLLTPQDFGLIGMVSIFIGLADLFATLGMMQSIIALKDINENHIRVATTVTIASGIIIYLIFYFSAPVIADFYNEQRLIPILRILSFLFILKGINTVSYGLLTKNLDFKNITLIQLSSNITYGLTSSILAFLGVGVWSLVYGQIISACIGMIITTRKYPINFKLLIKKKEFKDLAGYGTGVSLSNILYYAASNTDLLIIGKLANPFSLGLYTRALNLMTNVIDRVCGGMSTVLFPVFASVQDQKERLRIAYFRAIRTATFFLFPILAAMIITSRYIINGLYGVKWNGAVIAFQVLAFGGILRSTLGFSGTIAHATGRIYYEASQQLVYFLILAVCSYYSVQFGIEGVAFSVVIALIWMFIAQSWLALKIIEASWKDFFIALIPASVNLIFMVATNLILVFVLELSQIIKSYEIKLLITLLINIPVFISVIVFVPSSVKGDTLDWILERYSKYVPKKFLKFYIHFNNNLKLTVSNDR